MITRPRWSRIILARARLATRNRRTSWCRSLRTRRPLPSAAPGCPGDAGVGHQDLDRSPVLLDRVEGGVDLVGIGHVAGQRQAAVAGPAPALFGGARPGRSPPPGPRWRGTTRRRPSDAPGAAGDQDHPALTAPAPASAVPRSPPCSRGTGSRHGWPSTTRSPADGQPPDQDAVERGPHLGQSDGPTRSPTARTEPGSFPPRCPGAAVASASAVSPGRPGCTSGSKTPGVGLTMTRSEV